MASNIFTIQLTTLYSMFKHRNTFLQINCAGHNRGSAFVCNVPSVYQNDIIDIIVFNKIIHQHSFASLVDNMFRLFAIYVPLSGLGTIDTCIQSDISVVANP